MTLALADWCANPQIHLSHWIKHIVQLHFHRMYDVGKAIQKRQYKYILFTLE